MNTLIEKIEARIKYHQSNRTKFKPDNNAADGWAGDKYIADYHKRAYIYNSSTDIVNELKGLLNANT